MNSKGSSNRNLKYLEFLGLSGWSFVFPQFSELHYMVNVKEFMHLQCLQERQERSYRKWQILGNVLFLEAFLGWNTEYCAKLISSIWSKGNFLGIIWNSRHRREIFKDKQKWFLSSNNTHLVNIYRPQKEVPETSLTLWQLSWACRH